MVPAMRMAAGNAGRGLDTCKQKVAIAATRQATEMATKISRQKEMTREMADARRWFLRGKQAFWQHK